MSQSGQVPKQATKTAAAGPAVKGAAAATSTAAAAKGKPAVKAASKVGRVVT